MHSLRWIWGFLHTYRARIAIGLFCAVIVSALNVLNPYLAGRMVDDVMYGKQMNLLWPILGIMIAGTFLRTIIRYTYQMIFENVSQNVIYNIREQLYDRLHRLDFSFYDRTKTGDI